MTPDRPLRTTSLIESIGRNGAGESVSIGAILDEFRRRAFGVLLLIVLLPTFIPVPIGIGAVTGPLVALVGLQLLFAFTHPWLPGWIARREVKRESVRRFGARFLRPLAWLERLCSPRLPRFTDHTFTGIFTGLQIVLLGFLLSLPIPLTNYPFGILLLLYCIALIERDGVLLLVAWVMGSAAIVASALLSSEVIELVQRVVG